MADRNRPLSAEEKLREDQERVIRGESPLHGMVDDRKPGRYEYQPKHEREQRAERALDDREQDEGKEQADGHHDSPQPRSDLTHEPGSNETGTLTDPEEQKKAIQYYMEQAPWMREQLQNGREEDAGVREESALKLEAEKIEAWRNAPEQEYQDEEKPTRTEYQPQAREQRDDQNQKEDRREKDDRKPNRAEYQPGSYTPPEKSEHDNEREGR